MARTVEEVYFVKLLSQLGAKAPIRSGNLVNHITSYKMKTQYVIKISAKRYNEKTFSKSIAKGLQATYAGKAPKGRENEPRGVVKRQRSATSKYFQYDYAYVTQVKNSTSKGWVTQAIVSSAEEI